MKIKGPVPKNHLQPHYMMAINDDIVQQKQCDPNFIALYQSLSKDNKISIGLFYATRCFLESIRISELKKKADLQTKPVVYCKGY